MAFKLISRRSVEDRSVSTWHDSSAGSWKAWRVVLCSQTFSSPLATDWDSHDAMRATEDAFMDGCGLLRAIYCGQDAEKLARARSLTSQVSR